MMYLEKVRYQAERATFFITWRTKLDCVAVDSDSTVSLDSP